jgi:hypothetical protein
MNQQLGNSVIHDKCETAMVPLIPLSDPNKSEFYCEGCHASISADRMTDEQKSIMAGYIRSKQQYAARQEQNQPRQ